MAPPGRDRPRPARALTHPGRDATVRGEGHVAALVLPEEVRAEFRTFKRQSDLVVRAILREGVRNGEFVNGDEHTTIFAIDGMCNWLWKWYKASGSLTPDQIADQFTDLVLYGLAARGGQPGGGPAEPGREELLRYHARAIRFHTERLEALLQVDDPSEDRSDGLGGSQA